MSLSTSRDALHFGLFPSSGSPKSLASSKKTIAKSGASGSNCLVHMRGVRGAWRGAREAVECLARQMGEAWGRSEREVRKGRSP